MGDVWRDLPKPQGLYDPRNEHDACGIGFVANIKGKRSYGIVDDALKILENLKHRGGEGADQKSGDGAGILTQIPHEFFQRECEVLGFRLPPEGQYGVGMIFAHRYHDFREEQKRIFEDIVKDEGQTVLGWREVPIDESLIGEEAKRIRPHFLQVFIGRNPDLAESMDFERKLYIIRRRAEKKIIPLSEGMGTDFYIASLSSKTIVYKGMLTSDQMRHFYLDLSDLDFKTAMAMVHSRFSTNTFPSWPGPIRTATLCITGKSIPSAAISTGSMPGRASPGPRIIRSSPGLSRWWTIQAVILPCLITAWSISIWQAIPWPMP